MGIILAAVCAVAYGISDYCGGVTSRRSSALTAAFFTYVFSLIIVLCWLAVAGAGAPETKEITWAAIGGLAAAAGYGLFFASLATGPMSVIAPVTAATSAIVPVVIGVAVDGWPQLWALFGVVLALVAITLISWSPSTQGAIDDHTPHATPTTITTKSILLALGAGLGWGVYFALMSFAHVSDSSPWPALTVDVVGIVAVGIFGLAVARKRFLRDTTRTAIYWAIPSGVLGGIAMILYVIATGHGSLAIIAPIASLYPASTVALALIRDKEKLVGVQIIGMLLAGASLVLVGVS